jgi:integrase
MAQNPTYLTKNRLGTFIFQFRNPIYLTRQSSNVRANFRISLRTRNYKVALKSARIWWLVMQKIKEKYFDDADAFGDAQKLLFKLERADRRGGYEEVEPLLAGFDKCDMGLLEALYEYEQEKDHIIEAELNKQLLTRDEQFRVNNTNGPEQKPKQTLTEVIENFIEEKKKNTDPKNVESMEHKEYRPKLNLLVEVLGDKLCGELAKHDISKFKDVLFKFPKNRRQNPKYNNLSIAEIMKLDLNSDECISRTTIKNYATKIGIFLTWGIDNGYFSDGIKTPLRNIIKKTHLDNEERDPFSRDDLKKIFGSKQYLEGRHKDVAHFWVPLLGLFTGARENELCQLYVDDVYQAGDFWCVDLNKEDDKKQKNLISARVVPIHSVLIELGFVDFVNDLKERNVERLFMGLRKTRDGYATNFSKWFNRTYLNKRNCNVGNDPDEKKSFHSFRHTFMNYYKQQSEVNMDLVSELAGHKSGSTETLTRYCDKLYIVKRAEIIEKMRIEEIDFSKIKNK